MNLLDIFLKGGFIMWLILASSIVGLAVSIDRFIMLRKAKINVPIPLAETKMIETEDLLFGKN